MVTGQHQQPTEVAEHPPDDMRDATQTLASHGFAVTDPGHPTAERPGAQQRQHGGQEQQGADHHHEHGRGGRHRDAVEEVDAHHEQAEQRDDDRCCCELHGASRRSHRLQRRRSWFAAVDDGFSVSVDDEQRVVDTDTQADHRRQDRREQRDIEVGARPTAAQTPVLSATDSGGRDDRQQAHQQASRRQTAR